MKIVEITLYNGTTRQVSVTGINSLWWDATSPSGAPDYENSSAATNASGILQLNIDAVTSLQHGDYGFLLLYKPDSGDYMDSLVFAGLVEVKDLS